MIDFYLLENIESNPWQGRIGELNTEYIEELARDIAGNGLLQTPVGREIDNSVQLAFGHNRLAAFRWLSENTSGNLPSGLAGDFSKMPVDVRELSDEQMGSLAWSENERRRDLNPIERARAV